MTYSRRDLFGFLGSRAKTAASAVRFENAPPKPFAPGEESPRAAEAREAALEILASTGPEYGSAGLSNHGPMVVDALIALDRASDVLPWVEAYRRRLEERPAPTESISPEHWRQSLGDFARAADWAKFFRRELAERAWPQVLSDWCARLAPGASSAAFHGLIRTAHAARGLSQRETIARQGELAEGLGYWAARYRALPDTAGGPPGTRLPIEALPDVEMLEDAGRSGDSISDRVERVGDLPSFGPVAGMVDTNGDPAGFLTDLTETFAGVFLRHASDGNTIALIHAITGPSAVRLLLPHLDTAAARGLVRPVWQGAAAIYAGYCGEETAGGGSNSEGVHGEALVDRAVSTRDEHAIKLTEACLRENAAAARPDFLSVARDGVRRLGRTAPDFP